MEQPNLRKWTTDRTASHEHTPGAHMTSRYVEPS